MDTANKIAVNRFKPTKNVYVFIICLLLAFLFWLLNVLSKDYVTVIKLPVKYENLPIDKVPMNILPETFAVTAKVSGYSLIVGNAGEKSDTIIINGKLLRSINRQGRNLSFYHVRPILTQLATNNYSSYKIQEVLIDTLFVDFDKKVTKVLSIKPNLKVSVAKHHVIDGEIKFFPEAIRVTGPKSILDTMSFLTSNAVVFEEITSSQTATLAFDLLNDDRFELKPTRAIFTVEVEKNTEFTIEVPITTINVPKHISLKTFPNKVNITFLVPLGKFEYVDVEDFEMVIDYNDIGENSTKLTVKESKSLNFVTITRIEPGRLEYIIKK
jgi:YbbR domain-containing protein